MTPRLALAACLACLSALPASADPRRDADRIEARARSCLAGAGSNVEMKACSWQAYQDADGVLNRAYKAIVADLAAPKGDDVLDRDDAETLRRLKAAQRAWIAYRDGQCLLESAEMLGGTGEGLVESDCLGRLTIERVRALEDQFNPKDR